MNMAQIDRHPPLSPEMIERAAEAMRAWAEDYGFGTQGEKLFFAGGYIYTHYLARAALEAALPEAVEADSQAARDVVAERRRQISEEGWTAEHDEQHANGEMARAAACYAAHSSWTSDGRRAGVAMPYGWPWGREWWKPKDRRRDLVRAGALIIAEIERLDRNRKE